MDNHNILDELTLSEMHNAVIAVSGLFADMSHIGNRGQNFTWHRFPDMAAKYAKNQYVASAAKLSDVKQEAIQVYAKQFAKDLCRRAHHGTLHD